MTREMALIEARQMEHTIPMCGWMGGSSLGDVTRGRMSGAGNLHGEKVGEGSQEETPDLKGPMLTGERISSLWQEGAICHGWGRGIKLGGRQVVEEGDSMAAPCGEIASLNSGANPAGFTS